MATTPGYFSLLGISEDASQEELEARYRELADYLASPAIPAHLREWASQQAALVDEAYAVLADPERRAAAGREQQPATEAEAQPGSKTKKAGGTQHKPREAEDPDAESQEEPPEKVKRRSGAGGTSRRAAGRTKTRAADDRERPPGLRPQLLLFGTIVAIMLVVVIVLARYGFPGGGAGEVTEPDGQAGGVVPLDEERIAELMAAVEQDPNDPEVLFELGESFFQANEWDPAIEWFTRLLGVDPNDLHALTDIGTANFNQGRTEEAKAAWRAVLEIDAADVQAHYNLGFLYANAEPLDLAAARNEWQIVVDLAPDSDLATTAQVHLEGLLEEWEAEALLTPP